MKRILRYAAAALAASGLCLASAGCGDDGGGDDLGNNNRNLVACVGDSITQGYHCIGASYPARLAAMSGKQVKNYGVGGTRSDYGVMVIDSVLSRKPGYVCLLYGANDCIMSVPVETTVANLRRIVRACKANKTKVIVGTPTPMKGPHLIYNGAVMALVPAVKAMAAEEGVTCIDLNAAFGDGTGYLNPEDGLHMTEAGSDLIAKKFNSKM